MSVRTMMATAECSVAAQGVIVAPLSALSALRETPAESGRHSIPPRFLRHADEQTVVGLTAVLRAMDQAPLRDACFDDWGVVAAPMFPGRLGGAATFRRYQQGGPAAISPHIIPQNSLHSVSSAISISLAMRGPNFGIGGGPEALAEGLMVAMTFSDTNLVPGLWLVLTQWVPEPIPDGLGSTRTDSRVVAVALALVGGATQSPGGLTLRLTSPTGPGAGAAVDSPVNKVVFRPPKEDPYAERKATKAWCCSGPQIRVAPETAKTSAECSADGEFAERSDDAPLLELARWLDGGPCGRAAPWSYCLPWGGRVELVEANYLQRTRAA